MRRCEFIFCATLRINENVHSYSLRLFAWMRMCIHIKCDSSHKWECAFIFFATLRMNENVHSYSLRLLLLLRRMNKSHMSHEPKKQNTYEWDTCTRKGVRDETHGWECEFEKKSLTSLNTLVIFTSQKTREREIRHMNENVNVNANMKRSLSSLHMLVTLPSLQRACWSQEPPPSGGVPVLIGSLIKSRV